MLLKKKQTLGELTNDGIGLIEGIKCIINGTWERIQHGEDVGAVLRHLVTAIGKLKNIKSMMARPRILSLGHDVYNTRRQSSVVVC